MRSHNAPMFRGTAPALWRIHNDLLRCFGDCTITYRMRFFEILIPPVIIGRPNHGIIDGQ